jgi:hypothetical protein
MSQNQPQTTILDFGVDAMKPLTNYRGKIRYAETVRLMGQGDTVGCSQDDAERLCREAWRLNRKSEYEFALWRTRQGDGYIVTAI